MISENTKINIEYSMTTLKDFKNWFITRGPRVKSLHSFTSCLEYLVSHRIENIVCISKGIKSLPFKTKAKLFWLNWTNSLKSFEIDLVLVFISFCSNQLSLIFCSTILYTVELNPKPNLTVQLFFWSSHHHHRPQIIIRLIRKTDEGPSLPQE